MDMQTKRRILGEVLNLNPDEIKCENCRFRKGKICTDKESEVEPEFFCVMFDEGEFDGEDEEEYIFEEEKENEDEY